MCQLQSMLPKSHHEQVLVASKGAVGIQIILRLTADCSVYVLLLGLFRWRMVHICTAVYCRRLLPSTCHSNPCLCSLESPGP